MAEAQHGYRHTFSATLAKHVGLLLARHYVFCLRMISNKPALMPS